MLITKLRYNFIAKPWQYDGPNGWIFVSIPELISTEIRENLKTEEEGWGRLKAIAKIENTEWKTAIWFDTKRKTYLLPLKAAIRKNENLQIENEVKIAIWLRSDL